MRFRGAVVLLTTFVVGFGSGAVAYRSGIAANAVGFLSGARERTIRIPDSPTYSLSLDIMRAFPAKADVVMLGDSITANADWSAMFPCVRIANRGIPADNTLGMRERLDTILSTEANLAFIMAGVNDLALSDDTPDQVFARYSDIIDTLDQSMEVVVQSTLLNGSKREHLNGEIRKLNARLQEKCNSGDCTFVDLNRALAPDGVLKPAFTPDDLHLNGAGYRVWRSAIEPHVPKCAG